MKHLAGLGALALLVASSASHAGAFETTETLRCTYPDGFSREWKDGRFAKPEEDKISDPIHIDSINRSKQSARMIGNAGASTVLMNSSPAMLTFIEPSAVGGIWVTAVYPPSEGAASDRLPTVRALLTSVGGSAWTTIVYGTCKPLLSD